MSRLLFVLLVGGVQCALVERVAEIHFSFLRPVSLRVASVLLLDRDRPSEGA